MNNPKYIILDRDGVINLDSPNYIKSADEWNPISKSLDAIKKLTENEYQIIIISNQSGLGRGIISIIIGLIGGFLFFPVPDFSKSLLVGIILPKEIFPVFVSQSLLFLSFLIATFIPAAILKLR